MFHYILRRLLLLPLTLFCIVLVNFVIINFAPGDPTTVTEISQEGMATRREGDSIAFGSDDRYLQFREHYGLTLPVVINLWPFLSEGFVRETVYALTHRETLSVKEYNALKIRFGDQAKYVMPHLLTVMEDHTLSSEERQMALRFFVRGGTQQAILGYQLSPREKQRNRKVAQDNQFLYQYLRLEVDEKVIVSLREWYEENKEAYCYEPSFKHKMGILFETRFLRYMGRVLTLDFGSLRNDASKTVISEVTKRFKYSLTLAVLPLCITFFLSQVFGMTMAYTQNRWPDYSLNFVFLFLYAIPVFVVVPFLIEKVALQYNFPLGGFSSSEGVYAILTSKERLFDIATHIFLPLMAIMYGSLATTSRISRTAILEVFRQDYVRTARAKGVSEPIVAVKHVGRNAAITIVTSLAGSLGVVLGGSLIVETLFEINGFGKFFYDAVVNRDYNVIMFSALAGSFLSLLGYLLADLAYTTLDPRVTLE